MHLVVFPHTLVHLPVRPPVSALARDLVLEEVAGVLAAICLLECPFSILHPVLVGALESGAIWPSLYSLPMLLISFPLSIILRLFTATVRIRIGAVSVLLALEPMAVVYVTIGIRQLSDSTSLVLLPHSFISSAIREYSETSSMLLAILKLAGVGAPIITLHVLNELRVALLLKQSFLLFLQFSHLCSQGREEHLFHGLIFGRKAITEGGGSS